jgi:predicted nucleic acid-binding protein
VRVYFDSSALIKRGVTEDHSEELRETVAELRQSGDGMCSSSLAWIEVSRVLRSRLEAEHPARVVELVDSALAGVDEVPLGRVVSSLARRIGSPRMRSLDAIHLAAASVIDADLVVAYDRRLLGIASEMGFATLSPGVVTRT